MYKAPTYQALVAMMLTSVLAACASDQVPAYRGPAAMAEPVSSEPSHGPASAARTRVERVGADGTPRAASARRRLPKEATVTEDTSTFAPAPVDAARQPIGSEKADWESDLDRKIRNICR